MRCHPPTRAWVERRTKQGLSKLDILGCWKRSIARAVYHHLTDHQPSRRPLARNRRHQPPQQHGHDRAERQHASPTSRTVASPVEPATGPNSSWFWSSWSSPTAGSPSAPRPRPPRSSGRCRPRRSRSAAGACPGPRPGCPCSAPLPIHLPTYFRRRRRRRWSRRAAGRGRPPPPGPAGRGRPAPAPCGTGSLYYRTACQG
jgi:hypothetical protein